MKNILLFLAVVCGAINVRASYLPFLGDIRSAIVARQVALSNAPPISTTAKKELTVLRSALRQIDKTSTSLKTDLSTLSSVVLGIGKGASNETFALLFHTAVSNYAGVLIQTNDTLHTALVDADNNPVLKAKAQMLLDAAVVALAGMHPETDLNNSATDLGGVLTKYLAAGKAVAAAVNAKWLNPPSGKLIVDVACNRYRYAFGAVFPIRNSTATGIVGTGSSSGSSSTLILHIPSNGGPGTYAYSLTFTEYINGQPATFNVSGSDAQVTAANSSVVAGNFIGTGQYAVNGTSVQNVRFSCRFNGKSLLSGVL